MGWLKAHRSSLARLAAYLVVVAVTIALVNHQASVAASRAADTKVVTALLLVTAQKSQNAQIAAKMLAGCIRGNILRREVNQIARNDGLKPVAIPDCELVTFHP